jgi:hypothetical protein
MAGNIDLDLGRHDLTDGRCVEMILHKKERGKK